jgi:deoxyribodipyrimidine photo-lyase
MAAVPTIRIRAVNDAPVSAAGDYVLYWMIAARRTVSSFALDRAIELARELDRPLVVLEALRIDHRWANDRLHAFVLQGMADNDSHFAESPITYYPFVELEPKQGSGLLEALAASACAVVTDEFPAFFLPRMVASIGERIGVRLEAIDGNGLLPLRENDRLFTRAVDFRRHLQRVLPEHLGVAPTRSPLSRARDLRRLAALPDRVLRRWPRATPALLDAADAELRRLPIDHAVPAVTERGGAAAGSRVLRRFVRDRLPRYGEHHQHPDDGAASGLSPYLHFGHVGSHQVFSAIAREEEWSVERLAPRAAGSKAGWWGTSASAEAFLDQLVTWRELGLNFCARRSDFDRYESLPAWARATLEEHASDPRPHVYGLPELEAARTHDPLWNAIQSQLLHDGRSESYLRMLWGKKILEWSPSPQAALDAMIALNDRWALDGRDPNSYSGICWCLGRYDRPWAPKRPIFGAIRFMSSASAQKKLHLKEYLARWSRGAETELSFTPPGRGA